MKQFRSEQCVVFVCCESVDFVQRSSHSLQSGEDTSNSHPIFLAKSARAFIYIYKSSEREQHGGNLFYTPKTSVAARCCCWRISSFYHGNYHHISYFYPSRGKYENNTWDEAEKHLPTTFLSGPSAREAVWI